MRALQHEEVAKALLATGGALIVKHISTYPPGDGWWDDGVAGEGGGIVGGTVEAALASGQAAAKAILKR
ncbi:MAG TPA: hypothetical protein VJK73_02115 [Candidatus Paceibacterota bacterium]